MGANYIGRSGLGDELNHVPVNKHTFLSTQHANIFALGDAAAIPTSKAGSVAHFAVELFTDNFLRYIQGQPMQPTFDGHANCFVETGYNKALLIDFNYEVEPLPGKFPYAGIGPMPLLKESRLNHWGKLAFRWIYWNMLLKGRHLPILAQMSMSGKVQM
jgi:sulfide:quinone oxidoreductase